MWAPVFLKGDKEDWLSMPTQQGGLQQTIGVPVPGGHTQKGITSFSWNSESFYVPPFSSVPGTE